MKHLSGKWLHPVLVLASVLLNGIIVQNVQAQVGSSTYTGSMSNSTYSQVAIPLINGKVLIIGGADANTLSSGDGLMSDPELYDPVAGTWTVTPLNQLTTRDFQFSPSDTVTVLTNGKVLFVGGALATNNYLYENYSIADADLFDPATSTWTLTGSLNIARQAHTATLLPNGKVLVVGGWGNTGNGDILTTEIYDPNTGLWTTNGNTLTPRSYFTATLLANGKVLIAGGQNAENILSSAEIYDPETGTATAIVLNNLAKLSSGGAQITFTNAPGANFTALATTNLSLPLSNWTTLGSVTQISSGQYQFTDTQATNTVQRFYRVRSP